MRKMNVFAVWEALLKLGRSSSIHELSSLPSSASQMYNTILNTYKCQICEGAYSSDNHVRLSVSIASEVFCHNRFFSPTMRDVITMVIHAAV